MRLAIAALLIVGALSQFGQDTGKDTDDNYQLQEGGQLLCGHHLNPQKAPWLYGPEMQNMKDDEPYTLFHPTRRAIINFFRYWRSQGRPVTRFYLQNIIKLHILPGIHGSKDFKDGNNVMTTTMNDPAFVNKKGGGQCVNVIKNATTTLFDVNFGVAGWARNTAHVVRADVKCKNVMVHFVDKVFWFPQHATTTLSQGKADSFNAAVSAAQMGAVMDTGSNMTFFVPYNSVLDGLLGAADVEPAKIKGVLSMHTAHGAYFANDIAKMEKLTMLDGSIVKVDLEDHTFRIGGAKVALKDVLVRNGVVHVVDGILKPTSTMESGGEM